MEDAWTADSNLIVSNIQDTGIVYMLHARRTHGQQNEQQKCKISTDIADALSRLYEKGGESEDTNGPCDMEK
eukprot:CAMPEP_0114232606 /NCGR_PEP_ID=MMETSP0058-20121206/4702_1 /TAXON_ID=36894 /ORGANISM="Pyramimonas parkeae, CCMP726" /LENGTH=71 /DNA_ID=CAMNT_0001344103 /DNA_START=2065 /DNA_END=2280 /DNA_ORIENTATION=+